MSCTGHAVCTREMRNAYKVEVHEHKWKISVHDWKHNIKLYLKKEGRRILTQLIWGTVSGL